MPPDANCMPSGLKQTSETSGECAVQLFSMVPLEKDQALQLYIEAKRQMTIRMAIIGTFIVIVLLFLGAIVVFRTGV